MTTYDRALRSMAMAALLLGEASAAQAQPFRPTVTFCNRTLRPMTTAIAYDLIGTTKQTTDGWYKVQACTCRTLMQNRPLRATEVFVMATRDGVNLLRDARPGLCVKSTAFSFREENGNPAACAAAGGRPGMFKWYDTGGRTKTISLTRPGECNLMGDH